MTVAAGTGRHRVLDLTDHLDSTGFTRPDATDAGALNIWGNTFATGDLPAGHPHWLVDGVPFRTAEAGGPDHLRCRGQYLEVPIGRYDWLHLLATAERRTEDPVLLHFADGAVDPEWLRVSDLWPGGQAHFGEAPALRGSRLHYPRHVQADMRPTLWAQRVAVPRRAPLVGLRLPENPALHVFAVTLERPPESPEASCA
ncbi:hypothetical protein [Micromonospora sp. RP3T]|uniref:hypothetical protein n=1 Tax=Micromonospora sp. RP3T TaxID=2135446 RepID=UPI000D172380|nr:hypothetical protein [Micromonospora sp. RP3T]PTA46528.1 hypothetical protein C8054_09055 [Micromonospora sp. RP3T]